MNILHITNGLSEGGVETLLYSFSRYLVKKGHVVSILVLNSKEIDQKERFENAGVKIIVGKYNPYNLLNILLIKKYIAENDIVHVHLFPGQLFTVIANILLRKKRKSLITTEHNTWNYRRKYVMLRFLDRWFYKRYSYIIAISSDTSIALKGWLADKCLSDRIITINNGVELFAAPAINIKDVACSEDDFVLTMVARFNAQKEQDTLIKALTFLPLNVHVVFVGTGETLEYNKQLAIKYGVNERIYFAGHREDVSSILKISQVGVLCSNWEGFGLAVVEYMLAGLPVIATDVPGLSSIVGWNKLLYEKGNPNDLAKKILALMTNASFYEQAREYCMNRAHNFSIERMSIEYLSVYYSLLGKNSCS